MNRALFFRELRANAFVAGVIAVVLALYIGVIVSMFDPELGASLDMMMESMPELFAAFGMANAATTLTDFLINYLYGFLLTMFPFVLILIMVNKLMVRYIDRGTMAYLLATPNSRCRIAVTLASVLAAVLVVLIVVTTALEVGFSEALFPGDLDTEALLRINGGLLALWLFLAGMCFFSACLFSNAGLALWAGGGLGILLFLMQMVGQAGDKFEWLKDANPLMLYDATGLAASEDAAIGGAVALGVVGIVLFAAAVVVFDRRDLSV